MNRQLILIAGLLAVAGTMSCRKFTAVEPPPTAAPSELVFSDAAAARSAVTGVYGEMMRTNLLLVNGGATVYPALSADELTVTTADGELNAFAANSLTPAAYTTGLWARLWAAAYRHIYHANAVLEGLERSELPDSIRRPLMGEMRTVRALCYGQLAGLFGDVPLVVATDFRETARLPRAPAGDVYAQIISDLQQAAADLPEAYPTPGRTRPNKWAATALLARVQLYLKNYRAAEEAAGAVIESGTYTLPANLASVFTPTSPEAIWQVVPVSTVFHTGEGNAFVSTSTALRPTYVLTPSLLGAFEAGDSRKSSWVKTVTVGGQPYTFPYKYKVKLGGPPYTEYATILRLAEVYLVRAEARLEQGKLPEAAADLSAVRARAGLPPLTAATEAALRSAVERERRIELAFEWGHRWQDLRRWGKATTVLQPLKGAAWQAEDQLYPIPQLELKSNPALTQNPGY